MKNTINKLIEYGIYTIAFLLPFQTRLFLRKGELGGEYWEYATISLYFVDIIIVMTLLLVLYKNLKEKAKKVSYKTKNSSLECDEGREDAFGKNKKDELKLNRIWILIGALELVIFISLFMATDRVLALYVYGRFLLAVLLFWMILNEKFKLENLIYYFFFGVLVHSLIGIWQFLNQSDFANVLLGMAYHDSTESGASVVEVLGEDGLWQRWLRAYGGLDHPNILGGLLSVSILLLIFNLITIVHKSDFELGALWNRIKYLISYILVFIFEITLFFTFSRAAWIAFTVGFIIILLLTIIKKDLLSQLIVLKILLFSGILVFALTSTFSDLVYPRFKINNAVEVKSISERIGYTKESIELIRENRFFGVGIGNYGLAIREDIALDRPFWYYQPVHNVFLLIWAELGVFGIGIFAYLMQTFFNEIRANARKNKLNYYKLSIFVSIIILMMFDHWLWSLHFGVLFIWFVLGVLLRGEDIKYTLFD